MKRNVYYSMKKRPNNCFHCWFVFTLEIKVKKLFKYKYNLVHFGSLLGDFFLFINEFKYIYFSPNFENIEHTDTMFYSFCYYLDNKKSCLCHHPPAPQSQNIPQMISPICVAMLTHFIGGSGIHWRF